MSRKIEVEIFTDYEPGHCTIATIMARGRGTTLHAKNSFKIAGKPLMEWFLDEITQAECIDYTFVWTESEEIAEITTKYRNVHAIHRPKSMIHYASGFHSAAYWDQYVADRMKEIAGTSGDLRIHLNCNNVLLRADTIEAMYDKLLESAEYHLIQAYTPIDPHIFMIHNGEPFPVWSKPGLDRQKHPQLYRKSSISIYHTKRAESMYINKELPHIIPRTEAFDFQNSDDIHFAEYMLNKRHRSK